MGISIDKFDVKALDEISEKEILSNQDELLKWLQDCNWPVSGKVIEILTPHIQELESSIIKILRANDLEWKYNVISKFLYYAQDLSQSILREIKLLSQNPNESEDIREECQGLICKFDQ